LSQFPRPEAAALTNRYERPQETDDRSSCGPAGEFTEWSLAYTHLTDAEMFALSSSTIAAEGTLNGFTFVDPSLNLLAWSDHLNNSAWAAWAVFFR